MVLCKISTYLAHTNAYKKPIKKPHLLAMNVIEKRDFIHSHLHRVNEKTINEFYEKLRDEEITKAKLECRALKSESDILSGKVFSREEIEQRTANLGRK